MATIGRLMRTLTSLVSCLARIGGDCFHRSAVAHLHQSLDHDAFTSFQTVGDDPQLANALSHRYRTDGDLVIAPHHRDLITALQFHYGSLRNQQSAGLGLRGEANASKSPGTKKIGRIRKDTGDPYGPSCGVYFTVGKRDRSSPLIHTAVRQNQLKRYALPLLRHTLFGGEPAMEVREHLLAHGDICFDRIDL